MDSISPENFHNKPLEIASLPRYEEVSLKRLEPNYLVKRNIGSSISLLMFLGFSWIIYFFIPEPYISYFLIAVLAILLLMGWGFITNYQLYKRNAYGMRERDIIYKRGFMVERTTVVPFHRLQHVSTHRSMLDKFLGLSTLKIFTAGGSGSDIAIPGLTPETADSLKQSLAERMNGHE